MKFKKTFAFATVTTAFAGTILPFATSCGETTLRYDTTNNNEIVLGSSWAVTGIQYKALSTIIDTYNQTQSSAAGYVPVKLNHFEGGYDSFQSQLTKKFSAKDKDTLPNLIVAYNDVLGVLSQYKMQLDFKDKTILEKFDPSFTRINQEVAALDSNGVYAVPFASSSELASYNMPVLKYFFEKIESAGGSVSASATGIVKDVKNFVLSDVDRSDIVTLWGSGDNTKLSQISISESDFESYEAMINMANKLQLAFNKSSASLEHVMGYDAPTNLLYTLAYAKGGYELSNMLFTKNQKTGRIDYTFLTDPNSTQKQNFDSSYNLIKSGLDSGGLWLNGNGTYSSNYMRNHKYAFSIGSTAGYTYNFFPNEFTSYKITASDTSISGTVYDVSGVQANKTIDFASGNYTNHIYLSTSSTTPGNYDYQASSASDDTKLASVSAGDFISTSSEFEGLAGVQKISTNKGAIYLIPASVVTKTQSSPGQWLQESELRVNTPPAKLKNSDSKKVYFVQGPSIIGVHANSVEDQGAEAFVQWLANNQATQIAGESASQSQKPINYFDSKSNYITPLKDSLKPNSELSTIITAGLSSTSRKYWVGPSIAWDALSKASNNADTSTFDTVVDPFSGLLRKTLDSKFLAARDTAHNSGSAPTAKSFYDSLVTEAKVSNIID